MKKLVSENQQAFPFSSADSFPVSEIFDLHGTIPVVGDAVRISPTFERRAASRFVTAGDQRRQVTSSGLAVTYEEFGLTADVEMRPKSGQGETTMTDAAAFQLRELAKNVGGTDEDVLDLLLANAVQNQPDNLGWNWIEIDDMLVARSRGVRSRRISTNHKSGTEDSAREAVWQAVRMYASIYVSYGKAQKEGRKTLRDYSPLVIVERIVMAEGTMRAQPVRIAYRFGSNLGDLSDSERSILIPRSLLQLNTKTEAMPKAVGRYFVLNCSSGSSPVVRSVQEVIQNAGIEIPDHANRGRVRDRLEKSLDDLVQCGVFRTWDYVENRTGDRPEKWANKNLPYQNWLDKWLSFEIQVKVDVRQDAVPASV